MILRTLTPEQTYPIRHKVLRPDGPLADVFVDGDVNALHLGIEFEGVLVGVGSLFESHEQGDQSVRLRKLAVLASHQKRGFGGALIRAFEQEARHRHMRHFWFDARKTAAGFYQRLGFEGYGDAFQKNDRAYIRMQKIL